MKRTFWILPIIAVVTFLFYSEQLRVEAKTAKCFLSINGTTHINGLCNFEFTEEGNGSFYFNDMKQKTRCINPAQAPGECTVAYTVITRNGIFGFLSVIAPGRGLVYWNEGVALQADGAFPVTRNGACWESSRVRLCAW